MDTIDRSTVCLLVDAKFDAAIDDDVLFQFAGDANVGDANVGDDDNILGCPFTLMKKVYREKHIDDIPITPIARLYDNCRNANIYTTLPGPMPNDTIPATLPVHVESTNGTTAKSDVAAIC